MLTNPESDLVTNALRDKETEAVVNMLTKRKRKCSPSMFAAGGNRRNRFEHFWYFPSPLVGRLTFGEPIGSREAAGAAKSNCVGPQVRALVPPGLRSTIPVPRHLRREHGEPVSSRADRVLHIRSGGTPRQQRCARRVRLRGLRPPTGRVVGRPERPPGDPRTRGVARSVPSTRGSGPPQHRHLSRLVQRTDLVDSGDSKHRPQGSC